MITARGRHFASRVSESLLNAMNLSELVGSDAEDMIRIARRVGTDAPYRTQLRERVAALRLTAPLFDTVRFTRDFESAIDLMVERHRQGPGPGAAGCAGPGARSSREPRRNVLWGGSPRCRRPIPVARCATARVLRWATRTVPGIHCGTSRYRPPWNGCAARPARTFTARHHWTDAGFAELAQKRLALAAGPAATTPAQRASWASVVERVVRLLGGYPAVLAVDARPIWVDVGAGDGALVMTASDYGFGAIGVDVAAERTVRIQQLGFNALHHDFMSLRFDLTPRVMSMMDLLQQLPFPRAALLKAAQILPAGAVLVVSAPDLQSSGWKLADPAVANGFWAQLENHHNFGRERLVGPFARMRVRRR